MKKILLTVSIAALVGCLMLPTLSEAGAINTKVTDPGGGGSGGDGGSSAILTGQVFGYNLLQKRVGVSGASVCNALNDAGTGSDLQACTTTDASGNYSFTMTGKENRVVDVWSTKTNSTAAAKTYTQTSGTVPVDLQMNSLIASH